jgi:hypothetical protein
MREQSGEITPSKNVHDTGPRKSPQNRIFRIGVRVEANTNTDMQ